jgi:hypothetical protein
VLTTGSTARPPLGPREGFGAEGLLVTAKNVLFHAACLRDERLDLAAKGCLMLLAARLGAYQHASMAPLPAFVRLSAATAVDAGAARTISTFRPVVQVEAAGLHGHGAPALTRVERDGYRLFELRSGRRTPATPGAVRSLNAYLVPHETVAALPVRAVDRETASR